MKHLSATMIAIAVMAGSAAAQVKAQAAGPALGPALGPVADPGDGSRIEDITDFQVTAIPGGVHVHFTSSLNFKAVSYDLKRSDAGITPDNFESSPGEIVGSFPQVGDPGEVQDADVTVTLPAGTSHFALRAVDALGNKLGYSNEDTLTVTADTTPPLAVANLRVTNSGGPITLAWNAPPGGDDAVDIQISYSMTPVTLTWTPLPAFNGQPWGSITPTQVSFDASTGLVPGIDYYFVAKARDAALNVSAQYSLPTEAARINSAPGGGGDGGTSGGSCPQSARGFASLAIFATALALLTRRA